MKQFLSSQQISLRQNLELLNLKMNRTSSLHKIESEHLKLSDNASAIATQSEELDGFRQWGSPTSKNSTYICLAYIYLFSNKFT